MDQAHGEVTGSYGSFGTGGGGFNLAYGGNGGAISFPPAVIRPARYWMGRSSP